MRNVFKVSMSFGSSLRDGIIRHSRKFGIIAASNIAIQAISLLGFVFVARLYQEGQIGEYVTFQAYVGIITILSTGYYDQALYVEKREAYGKLLKLVPIGFAIMLSIPVGAGLYLADVSYVPYIIISMISGGINVTASNICITQNKLVFLSIYRLVTAPLVPGTIIAVGVFAGTSSKAMIVVSSISSLVLATHLYFLVNPYREIRFTSGIRRQLVVSLALIKRYRKFFYYGMIGELIGTAAYRMPVIQINSYFGAVYAAYFGIAMRIVITPISVLTGTVSQMFLYKVSENKKNGVSSMRITLKSLALLSILGVISSVFCTVLAEPIIVMLLGDRYVMVGESVYWLSPFIFSLITISPLTQVLTVYEKQEYAFYNKLAQLVLSVVAFLLGNVFDSYILGVKVFSLSMTMVYVVILGQIINVLLHYDRAYKNNLEKDDGKFKK
jgi:O-antigen/teichoic acid export membrane protein